MTRDSISTVMNSATLWKGTLASGRITASCMQRMCPRSSIGFLWNRYGLSNQSPAQGSCVCGSCLKSTVVRLGSMGLNRRRAVRFFCGGLFGGMRFSTQVVEFVGAGKVSCEGLSQSGQPLARNLGICRGGGGVSMSVVASTDAGSVESRFRRKIVGRFYFHEEIRVECDILRFATLHIDCRQTNMTGPKTRHHLPNDSTNFWIPVTVRSSTSSDQRSVGMP